MEAARFEATPKAIMIAIARLAGDANRTLNGDELLAELRTMGHQPDTPAFVNLMKHLKDDGYIHCRLRMGGVDGIGLAERGRRLVEGSSTSELPELDGLLALLAARSEDEDLPESERRRARSALEALADLGAEVWEEIFGVWLKSRELP